MKRATHLSTEPESTRCGEWIEALETRVSSRTRERVLETTSEPEKVTCKRCLRAMMSDRRRNKS